VKVHEIIEQIRYRFEVIERTEEVFQHCHFDDDDNNNKECLEKIVIHCHTYGLQLDLCKDHVSHLGNPDHTVHIMSISESEQDKETVLGLIRDEDLIIGIGDNSRYTFRIKLEDPVFGMMERMYFDLSGKLAIHQADKKSGKLIFYSKAVTMTKVEPSRSDVRLHFERQIQATELFTGYQRKHNNCDGVSDLSFNMHVACLSCAMDLRGWERNRNGGMLRMKVVMDYQFARNGLPVLINCLEHISRLFNPEEEQGKRKKVVSGGAGAEEEEKTAVADVNQVVDEQRKSKRRAADKVHRQRYLQRH
jgi:hypothetical protein